MSILDIGYSGIRASQTQLNTMAMNIANEQTPGYTRRRVEQHAIVPMSNVGMSTGNGVEVSSIRRLSDQYLIAQTWRASSQTEYYGMVQRYLDPLETVLGDENTNMNEGMNKFFSSLSEATTQPGSSALRLQIRHESQSLAMRFNNVNKFISRQKSDIQRQRATIVELVNTLNTNIATYNQKIVELELSGGDNSVLRDQRDELVKDLSKLMDVRVNEDDNGNYTVTMTSGQPLVSGRTASSLAVRDQSNGEQRIELTFSGTTFQAEMSCGSQLGALHDYESGTLQEIQTTVLGMAEVLATAFNAQLAQGFDQKGDPGKPLFKFDLTNADGMLQVNPMIDDELAFSSRPGEVGNGDNLQKLIEIKNQEVSMPGMGNMTVSDVGAALISQMGIISRQNKIELTSASNVQFQAETQRNNVSGVDSTEEGMNLMTYTQLYQANLKLISTGDRIFNDLLGLF